MITNLIIVVCALVFVYIRFISSSSHYDSAMRLGALYPPYVRNYNEYYRLFACHFIHIDFMHCFMNLYAIYNLGGFFEYLLGTSGYIVLILCSMIVASLVTMSVSNTSDRANNTMTIGASGIFYGYLGAMIALAFMYQGFFMELLSSYMMTIVINIAYTFMNRHISKTGHFGGMLGGAIAIVVLKLVGLL